MSETAAVIWTLIFVGSALGLVKWRDWSSFEATVYALLGAILVAILS